MWSVRRLIPKRIRESRSDQSDDDDGWIKNIGCGGRPAKEGERGREGERERTITGQVYTDVRIRARAAVFV